MCPVFIKAKEVAFMRRTEVLQEYRKMRFEQVYTGWKSRELTQEQAAGILGISDRTFRRLIPRYQEAGLAGLLDKRLNQASHRQSARYLPDMVEPPFTVTWCVRLSLNFYTSGKSQVVFNVL